MGMFGRALGGAGRAAADIGNKYIDADLANQRAQILADIQRKSQMQTVVETDKYTRDPARLEAIRGEQSKDAARAGADARAAALGAANDTELTAAQVAQQTRVSEGTLPTRAREAAIMGRIKSDEELRVVNPGDVVMRGAGTNPGLSGPEASVIANRENVAVHREALGAKKGEDRDRNLEAQLKSDQILDLSKTISKGVADGTLSTTKLDAKGKENPGYTSYQYLLGQQRALSKQRDELVNANRQSGERAPGPIPALNKGGSSGEEFGKNLKAGGKAEAGMAKDVVFSPAERAREDRIEASPENLKAIDAEILKAKSPEHRRVLQDERANIERRIADKGPGTTTSSKPTAPVPTKIAVSPPAAKPDARPAAPEYVPPADSIVGRQRARTAEYDRAAAQASTDKQAKAQEVFAAIAPDDIMAAVKLQASPLFGYLTPEQKKSIYQRVNQRR